MGGPQEDPEKIPRGSQTTPSGPRTGPNNNKKENNKNNSNGGGIVGNGGNNNRIDNNDTNNNGRDTGMDNINNNIY